MNAPAMNGQSVLDMLEPLREPAPPSLWPPAPGWWILALIVALLLIAACRWLWRYHRRGAPLREAKAQLKALQENDLDPRATLSTLGELQRRLAIRIAGRERCAGLTGPAWADFLNGMTRDDARYFDATLWEAAYRPTVEADDARDALDATRRWLDALERPQ